MYISRSDRYEGHIKEGHPGNKELLHQHLQYYLLLHGLMIHYQVVRIDKYILNTVALANAPEPTAVPSPAVCNCKAVIFF